MKHFDVQAIEIAAPCATVFAFVSNPSNLTRWTHAFARVEGGRARLATPAGDVDIGLQTLADPRTGTVDWRMEFPDGTVGIAQSRVTETTRGTSIYSFVLHAPPVALEKIEGALEAQRKTLSTELSALKRLLES
jgi:hypothetical protein